jgi:nifR3 family TIM-barrel protein
MQENFWRKLGKPIFALAPMADVTDAAFRFIVAKYGKPHVMFTEFVSTDALMSPGKTHVMRDLFFHEIERPIVAQVFGVNPDHFAKVADMLRSMGFDGIDINMGCPERNIVKQGAGAALIQKPKLAQEIVLATKDGAGGLPVSVKTRIGFNSIETENWISSLLHVEPEAITVHGRTKKEMSKVPAHWDEIKKSVMIRDKMGVKTFILGNGDVRDVADAYEKVRKFRVDGVMLGRTFFGNPWLFGQRDRIPLLEKLRVLLEHVECFETFFKGEKNFSIMKKHFKAYMRGFNGAKELRIQLMNIKNLAEAKSTLMAFRERYKDKI